MSQWSTKWNPSQKLCNSRLKISGCVFNENQVIRQYKEEMWKLLCYWQWREPLAIQLGYQIVNYYCCCYNHHHHHHLQKQQQVWSCYKMRHWWISSLCMHPSCNDFKGQSRISAVNLPYNALLSPSTSY